MIQGKKVIAVVQARMESTRLPGKILMPLGSKPALGWVLERIAHSKYIDRIILAIPNSDKSIFLVGEFYKNKWDIFSDLYVDEGGEMENVYMRVIKALNHCSINEKEIVSNKVHLGEDNKSDPIIVDITADCPLVDPRHIDFLIEKMRGNVFTYASNVVERTWPDGCDIQVYYSSIFFEVYKSIEKNEHKAHTGWNIMRHIQNGGYSEQPKFMFNYEASGDLYWPTLRITLDTKSDYRLLNHIFTTFESYGIDFSVEDVIRYLRVNPSLVDINREIKAKIPGEG